LPRPRIVSFLPSATEMVCALGLADQLAGITHECDYPPEIRAKPVVVRPALPLETMSLREIDAAVSERMRAGASLYEVDEPLLRELAPDLILTQNLCQVCAPSGNEISRVLQSLPKKPEIIWLTPKSLGQIFENLREIARVTGTLEKAEAIIAEGRARLDFIAARASAAPHRPRVFCLEWVDPPYGAGHWMPEMVDLAGGIDSLSRRGADSVRVPWEAVVDWAPEVLVITPCGFKLAAAIEQTGQLFHRAGWTEIPAVKQGRVFAVDANSYFARPGPRVVDGTALLARLIHPDLFEWTGPRDAFARVKSCAACGGPFSCQPGDCWCDGVKLSAAAREKLQAPHDDCLCPKCLAAAG